MSDKRIDKAMARIEAALARIEAAQSHASANHALGDSAAGSNQSAELAALSKAHEALRSEVAQTLGELDTIIEGLEA